MTKRKFTSRAVEKAQRQILDGVGYGEPPKHTRFQKGVSGNPAGRPRKAKPRIDPDTRAEILSEGRRMVSIQDKDGRTTEMPAHKVMRRSQFKSGAKGNAHAQENYLKRYERAEIEEREYIECINTLAELQQAKGRLEIEEARKAGRPEPELTPHPDDMIIEPGKPFEIRGPATPEALQYCKRYFANREVLLMMHILEQRDGNATTALSLLRFIRRVDASLPERMRLSENEITFSRYRRMTRRALDALIRKTCKELGSPVPSEDLLRMVEEIRG